jgi:hypothetical protein
MDDIWLSFISNFESILEFIPYHANIINILSNELDKLSNILLYSPRGFPLDLIYITAFKKRFGIFKKNPLIWDKDVQYNESPYFFEIDLSLPSQPKDLVKLTELIKHIANSSCIHFHKHIIVIKHIEFIINNNKSFDFRVLFERYSKNVLFICLTHHYSRLETPIKSRFISFRIPLLTTSQIVATFSKLNLHFHPILQESQCRDLYFALYIHYLYIHQPSSITPQFCTYKCPNIALLPNNPSIEDIREITHKISINDSSICDITSDLLLHTKNKHLFISTAAHIEHLLVNTEFYRKPLYIEYLFHCAFYRK